MSSATIDHPAKTRPEAIPLAGKIELAKAEILIQSGNASIAGFVDLAKAYQAMATKNAERLSASLQALAHVKTPSEFLALQHKLIAESVESAVSDGTHIAKLTTGIFTAAFEPVKKQLDSFQVRTNT